MSDIEAVAIVHIQENGNVDYYICGDERFRLLVIDENAPSDRVYEMTRRSDKATIKALLRDDPIGSRHDERHQAISAIVEERLTGKPRLSLIAKSDDHP